MPDTLPADLTAALDADAAVRAAWDHLPPSHRKEHLDAIADAKKPETRARERARNHVGGTGLGRIGRTDRSEGRLAEVRANEPTVPGVADARRIAATVAALQAGRTRTVTPSAKPLAAKLALKPGMSLRIVGAPAGFDPGPLPDGVTTSGGDADAVLVFADSPADVERLAPTVLAAVRPTGSIWGAYRKGGPALNRDRGWEPFLAAWLTSRRCRPPRLRSGESG